MNESKLIEEHCGRVLVFRLFNISQDVFSRDDAQQSPKTKQSYRIPLNHSTNNRKIIPIVRYKCLSESQFSEHIDHSIHRCLIGQGDRGLKRMDEE